MWNLSMSYTGKVLWTVWELDVEDYEILLVFQLEVYYNKLLNKNSTRKVGGPRFLGTLKSLTD